MKPQVTILLVEDDAFSSMTLCDILAFWGYHVYRAVATGEEALVCVVENSPDVVITDINLAGDMDGLELAGKIQACSRAAIIFMTGYTDAELRKQAMRLNPLAYLVKPAHLDELRAVIDAAFSA